MWQYAGASDTTHCSNEEILEARLAIMARQQSKIADDDTFEIEPSVEPYSLKKPLPEVISILLNPFNSPHIYSLPFLTD